MIKKSTPAGRMAAHVNSAIHKESMQWMEDEIERAKLEALQTLDGHTIDDVSADLEVATHRYLAFKEFVELYNSHIQTQLQE